MRLLRLTIFAVESNKQYLLRKSILLTLAIQREMRMDAILSSMVSLAVKVFPHYLTNGTNFRKKLLNIKCVSSCSLQLLS